MPSFNQQQLAYKARNANTVALVIGDQTIAFCQSVSHSYDMGTEFLHGIGSAKPQEIQQLKVQPQITVNNINLTTTGERLTQGNTTVLAAIIANNQFNLFIVDGATNVAIFTYIGCVADGFSENISANQPITDDITFKAMDVLGPDGQSLLTGPNALTILSNSGVVATTGLGLAAV